MKQLFFAGIMALVACLPVMVRGTSDTYENTGSVTFPPQVDATNFVNRGSFILDLVDSTPYQTANTINYTNTGLMYNYYGFDFETIPSSGSPKQAASFFNSGDIEAGATFIDIPAVLPVTLTVWATNISNPGSIVMGDDDLIKFTGRSVDVSRGTLNILGDTAVINPLDWGWGQCPVTNIFQWDPSSDLGATYARSAVFTDYAGFYGIVNLTNSRVYSATVSANPNLTIIRAIFLQNKNPNIKTRVFINSSPIGRVEWSGTYIDPATGNLKTNFFYLSARFDVTTNIALINGIPSGYSFAQNYGDPLFGGTPTQPGLPTFESGDVTNFYSYIDAQVLPTTYNTNDIPNHSVTNLPGRVEMSADQDLDLSSVQITTPNYLLLESLNQFKGNEGADIAAAFSDIRLGVTNGILTVSNLMNPILTRWSGSVEAWNARWLTVNTNSGVTVTNDYQVLLVDSDLVPFAPTYVQDLVLHSTNTLLISDTFNVIRTLSIDAEHLTLKVNEIGYGASALDGELNVLNPDLTWADSVSRVRWLTNNGAIRLSSLNSQLFGKSTPTYATNITAGMPAVSAIGMLSEVIGRTNVNSGNKVVIGTNQYVFVGKLTNTFPNQVKIAGSFDGTISNLFAAINRTAGAGTNYSTNTLVNGLAKASSITNHVLWITARAAGALGNSIATSTTATNLTWNSQTTLYGGMDAIVGTTNLVFVAPGQYGAFINTGTITDNGSTIYADNFVNSGIISNGIGSFILFSTNATVDNSVVLAGAAGDIAIYTRTLTTSNTVLRAGRSLILSPTNFLDDSGITNGSIWVVGNTNGLGGNPGLVLAVKPPTGDLLGTTISNIVSGVNKKTYNIWAGENRGASVDGFVNNEAVGRLILDSYGSSATFYFSGVGAGVTNALYVDYLELRNSATNLNSFGDNDHYVPALTINSNLIIYYAAAVINGDSIAEKLDHKNFNRLRWVPDYAGYFSSTNVITATSTNAFNLGLLQSTVIDSDGDGIANASDNTPFFTSDQVNFVMVLTNVPPLSAALTWTTIPSATNYLFYQTNMSATTWIPLTNFVSPLPYPSAAGTVTVFDPVDLTVPRFYRVVVQPWLTYPY